VQARKAVSAYGLAVLQDDVGAKKILDEAEADLIVLALDAAARATGDPAAKQAISNLASAYLRFRDAWTGAAVQAIQAGTSHLESMCKS
jgi:hypothetical protein